MPCLSSYVGESKQWVLEFARIKIFIVDFAPTENQIHRNVNVRIDVVNI